jgi:hypothetical protein
LPIWKPERRWDGVYNDELKKAGKRKNKGHVGNHVERAEQKKYKKGNKRSEAFVGHGGRQHDRQKIAPRRQELLDRSHDLIRGLFWEGQQINLYRTMDQ